MSRKTDQQLGPAAEARVVGLRGSGGLPVRASLGSHPWRRSAALVLVLIACGCSASRYAAAPPGPTPQVTAALSTLQHAPEFSVGPVGEGRACAPPVRAFAVLLAQPNAAERFGAVLPDATPAGQLYALCGLFLTDRAAYSASAPRVLASPEYVVYRGGCIGVNERLAAMVQKPEASERPDIASGELPSRLLAYIESQP